MKHSNYPIFLLTPLIALMLGWSLTALAKDTGPYLGASIGNASVEYEDEGFKIDDDSFAYKLFGGYQFNKIFAIEGGFVDFGSPSEGFVEVDIYGLDVFGLAGFPLGPVRVFGKLGAIYWDADVDLGLTADEDGTDLAAGVGVDYELDGWAVRGEVEYFDAGDDVYFISIGASFGFE